MTISFSGGKIIIVPDSNTSILIKQNGNGDLVICQKTKDRADN